jgi:hypothetical protein
MLQLYVGSYKESELSITRDSIPFFKPEVEAIFELFDPEGVYSSVRDKLLTILDGE